MPARKNGPLSGQTHGTDWDTLPVGKPMRYHGTPNGAKANVWRANQDKDGMRFRSFKVAGEPFIERLQ